VIPSLSAIKEGEWKFCVWTREGRFLQCSQGEGGACWGGGVRLLHEGRRTTVHPGGRSKIPKL